MGQIHFVLHYLKDFNMTSILLRLFLSVVVGGIIGFERGRHGSAAGFRTHILVCVGAALTSLCSLYASLSLGLPGDIFRISAQVISGIGFLGAGIILVRNNSTVAGLTTAAGMWVTATLGIALGYGFYEGAVVGTVICVSTTTLLTKLERKTKQSIHFFRGDPEHRERAESAGRGGVDPGKGHDPGGHSREERHPRERGHQRDDHATAQFREHPRILAQNRRHPLCGESLRLRSSPSPAGPDPLRGTSEGITTQLTEHNLTLYLDEGPSPGIGAECGITIFRDGAEIRVKRVVTGIRQSRSGAVRSHTVEILDFCGNRYEYLQLLYDRVPTLPQSLRRDFGVLSHLWQNIAHRVARTRK